MADERTMPRLTGSIDLDAFLAADAAGDDLDQALEAATVRVEPPAELDGLTKDELLDVAEAEGVPVSTGLKKADVRREIEDARRGGGTAPSLEAPLGAAE